MNVWTITGRLVKDAEARTIQTKNGPSQAASFRMALRMNHKDEAEFIQCDAYGSVAKMIIDQQGADRFRQGCFVTVSGPWSVSRYTDKNGMNQCQTKITANWAESEKQPEKSKQGYNQSAQQAYGQPAPQGGYQQYAQPSAPQGGYQQYAQPSAPQGGYQQAQPVYNQPAQQAYNQPAPQGGYQQAQPVYNQPAPQGGYQQYAQPSAQQGYAQPQTAYQTPPAAQPAQAPAEIPYPGEDDGGYKPAPKDAPIQQ